MVSAQVFKVRSEDLSWREVGEELIVLDQRSSTYLGINSSGVAMWARLVTGATLDQLAAVLTDMFGLPEERARADAQSFLQACKDREFVKVSGGAD